MLKFLVLGSLRGGNQGIFGRNKRRPAAAFELKSNPNFTIRKFAGERCFRSIRKIGKISFLRAGSATPFKSTDTSRQFTFQLKGSLPLPPLRVLALRSRKNESKWNESAASLKCSLCP